MYITHYFNNTFTSQAVIWFFGCPDFKLKLGYIFSKFFNLSLRQVFVYFEIKHFMWFDK